MKKVLIAAAAALALITIYNKFAPVKIVNLNNTGTSVVCFGDSLTFGQGASSQASTYPGQLALQIERRVVRLGKNGDTAPLGLARIEQVKEHNPYMVIIEFGGNDFMRKVPFNQTMDAMEKMVDYVQQAGAVAVIVETGGNFLMSRYGKEYKKLAKRKGAVFVPAIMEDILDNPSLKSDQIHPNDEGYKIVAARVQKRIKKYL